MRIRVASLPKARPDGESRDRSPPAPVPAPRHRPRSGGQQVVQTAAAGEACTFDKYNGAGVAEARPQDRDHRLRAVREGGQPVPDRRDAVDQGRGREARHQAADDQRRVRPEQGDLRHQGDDRPGRPGADHLAAQLRGPRSGARLRQGEERADHDHRPLPDHQDGLHGLHRLGRLRLRRAGQARLRRAERGDRRLVQPGRPARRRRASTSRTTASRASRTRWPPRPPR